MKVNRFIAIICIVGSLFCGTNKNVAEDTGCTMCYRSITLSGYDYSTPFDDGKCLAGEKECGTIRHCNAGSNSCTEDICRTWREPFFCNSNTPVE